MKFRLALQGLLFLFLLTNILEAKTPDPYKVLGVDQKANQREIQKAFHKLSLQYHPDKNKNKGAQQKFEEINNAYEILSDEEKRKNYDLYGDEKGNPGFGAGPGDSGGYTYFTQGGQGNSGFNFRPNEWESMGGQGGSKSFSFSFGGPSGPGSFDFGLNDIFSNFFGGSAQGGSQFGGFSGSTRKKSETQNSPTNFQAVNSRVFVNEISDRGKSWLLLSYTPTTKGKQYYESVVDDVAKSLHGAMEVGSINCEPEQSFCKEQGIYPRRAPRVFVYSYNKASQSGSFVEYTGDLDAKSLKTFCQEHLPRFSRRVDLNHFEISSSEGLPRVMLLSTKKDTPVIWRALSGLYRKRFIIYDAEVRDFSDPAVRRLGVDALPAMVGWLSNGEKHVLKTGISVKDLKSAIQDLSALLDGFEKKNKKAASSQAKRPQAEEISKKISVLTGANFDSTCGEKTPVCIIGAFKSSKAREKLESILSTVSQKTLSRNRNTVTASGDAISYALLDAAKQSAFLNALDKSGFKSDKFLVAYKPRKDKFTAYTGEITIEEVEKFIGSVLNGDLQFKKVRQKPTVK